jgi:upstream activation factor subunit UAF30
MNQLRLRQENKKYKIILEMSTEMETVKAEIEKLTKLVKKLQRQLNKIAKTVPVVESSEPKKLSGFSKPMEISKELSTFLGVESDMLLSRTEVTQRITKYVKEHNLQNPENKREMTVDKKMKSIIKLEDGGKLTFFNLQRYLKIHYPTAGKKETPKPKAVEPKAVEPVAVKKVVKRPAKH